jgi:hypothetical protein
MKPPARPGEPRPIPADAATAIGDFARYPGCRLMLACAMCSWSRTYNPERVIRRLQELRTGGHATRLVDVAKRVGWNCPACARTRWRMQFAWPADLTEGEARRLAHRARN